MYIKVSFYYNTTLPLVGKNMLRCFMILCLVTSLYADSNKLKQISVQFQWKNQFEYAGFYVAKEKNYYKNAGFEVELKEWKIAIDINEEVASGKSQYGILRPSSLIDISKGKDLVYLAAIYQSNPLVLLANKASKIDSISKFKDKKIMITQDHIVDSSLVAMFKSQGVELKDMKKVKHSFNPKSLLNGQTDLMAAYISNEPYMLKEMGGEPVVFSPKDYGFDFYNDILAVNKTYFQNNRQKVQDFTNATLKGYEYAFAHKEEVIDMIYSKYNTLNKSKEALLFEAKELEKLAYYKTDHIGHIDLQKLDKIYDVYKLFGLAKSGLDVEDIVYNKASSNTKLNKMEKDYLKSKDTLKACISKEWVHPFSQLDENGKRIGLGYDYINVLKEKMNVNFVVDSNSSWNGALKSMLEKKCDIMPLTFTTKNKKDYIFYTKPYLKFPIVITTKANVNFVDGENELKGKSVAIVKNHYLKYVFKERGYKFDIIEVEDSKEGFKKVDDEEVFAFVDSLPTMVYELQNSRYNKALKISGRLSESLEISIGVGVDNTRLQRIVQKIMNSISIKEKQKILDKWIAVEYKEKIDYIFIIELIVFFIFLLAIALYWNRKIAYANKILQESQREIAQTNRKLKKIADTDKLTQLYNRSKIDIILQEELEINRIKRQNFGLCLLDIDFFKKINDTYGHQVGDEVLIRLANSLTICIRGLDCVGRWGGEEFMIIFPKISEAGLEKVAEKIRQQIKELTFDGFPDIVITASMGITMSRFNDTVSSIVKRADDALYRAKHSGRDCIIKD